MTNVRRGCALVLLAGLLTAGCASADEGEHADHAATHQSSAPASATAQQQAVTIAVRLAGGAVTSDDTRVEAAVGQPIELVVDSDTSDELHVHSDPDHSFEVKPAAGQRFSFTVAVPGRVEIELHDAGRTVATILVR
ncbi:hypothetical protein [Nocardia harenae]|uniref:hypothetical protein n=1 Tax=Nocardia harenae TaxID=358707 RepID=UPI00082F7441|nr:hypothetical protein [Nocardia harenae]